ncbi:11662_t:CDS:2, partial [Dentiscutata heterogama]
MPSHYPIPDNYVVETTYGKNERTVTCFINYYNNKPQYKIKFGSRENEYICSNLSPTAAANTYLEAYYKKIADEEKAKNPNLQQRLPNSKMNSIYLFVLHLKQIKLVWENRTKRQKKAIKPFSEITRQIQFERNRNFDDEINQQIAIVQAMDFNRISQSTYRALAAICQELPCEKVISERLKQINQIINTNIPIHLVELQQFKDKLDTSP